MKKPFFARTLKYSTSALMLAASLGVHAVDNPTKARLIELGSEFNVANDKLNELAQKKACTELEYNTASVQVATIRLNHKLVNNVIDSYKSQIEGKKNLVGILKTQIGQGQKVGKPTKFNAVIGNLAMEPDAMDKISMNRLIALANEHTQISFVDSTGKRRLANNKDARALEKDPEARAVLFNVAMTLVVNPEKLTKFKYDGGTNGDKPSADRLLSKKSNAAGLNIISDANVTALSSEARALIPFSQISIEAVPHFDSKLGTGQGMQGLNSAIDTERKQIDVKAVRRVLETVKKGNTETQQAPLLNDEQKDLAVAKIALLEKEAADLAKEMSDWEMVSAKMDFGVSVAGQRFSKCELAYKKTAPVKTETTEAKKAPVANTGVLKGISH